MFDIINAAKIIKERQNNESNIYYFSDFQSASKILTANGLSAGQLYSTDRLEEILNGFSNISFLGCVVSSHGDINGINCSSNIKPNHLLEKMQKIPGLTDGLLLLGQCYSGIFNMPKHSDICVIGASNFYPSISSPINDGRCHWSANVFLYNFFDWLRAPVDVDGDGQPTLLDAYKYTSYKTNNFLVDSKISDSKTFEKWCLDEQRRIDNPTEDDKNKGLPFLRVQALNERLSLYHNHQEAWISNQTAAMRLII
ncbi:MAG: hypothetical protein LBG89_00840 [Rickettsiales bacterium]|jgi:hypothetical protein|nr:hypothetical protein [Rickettsiales bacterium]